MAVSATIAAVVTASTVYTVDAQKKAAKKQQAAQAAEAEKTRAFEAQMADEAEARQRQTAIEQGQLEEKATTVYGAEDTTPVQSSNDLLKPRQLKTAFGSSNDRVGLGF